MGQDAARAMTEIERTRERLQADLEELEARLPARIRSMKALVGLGLASTALMGLLVQALRSRRSSTPSAEVIVRIVRDDERNSPKT